MKNWARIWLGIVALGPAAHAAELEVAIELPDVELVLPAVSPPHFQKEGLPYSTENELTTALLTLIGSQDYEAALARAKDKHGAELALLETLVNTDGGSYDKAGVDAVGAHIRAFLDSHGIACFRVSGNTQAVLPMAVNPLGEIRIAVSEETADAARRIIESHREDVGTKVVRLRDEFDELVVDYSPVHWNGLGDNGERRGLTKIELGVTIVWSP